MRSGSSLLLHLLMTSPQVIGCGERNKIYRDIDDLIVFAVKANMERDRLHWPGYYVDQLNHDRFLPDQRLLLDPAVVPILLFREPASSVCSMVEVFSKLGKFTLQEGIEYYRMRVKTLAHYADMLAPQKKLFALTYDELVADTTHCLQELQDYLGLSSTLKEHYRTYPFTGIRGDPSSRISSGHVVRQQVERKLSIDEPDLQELMDVYDACRVATGKSG